MIDEPELNILRACWHPVARSDAINDRTVGVQLLGKSLVVFRSKGNAVVAHDRCPHRGGPLSLGTYEHDGLAGPYHGLRFGEDGHCTQFPSRPNARLSKRLKLDLVRSQERHGLIWACLNNDNVTTLPNWEMFDRTDVQKFQTDPVRWNVCASRIAENFNDIVHFSTIHATTFGSFEQPVSPQKITETHNGFASTIAVRQQYRNTFDGPIDEVLANYNYDFVFPFSSQLTITYPDGEVECIQMAVMPESKASSLVFQQSARTSIGGDTIDSWRDFQVAINEEDRKICEALQPKTGSFELNDTNEISLPTDAFSIAYRKRWKALVRTTQ